MNVRLLSFFRQEDKERIEIIEVRHRVFKQILYPFLIFGLFSTIMGSLQAYQQGQWVFAVLYTGSYLIFVAAALPFLRIPLIYRSMALTLALLVVSVSILARIGLSGIGLELLLLACAIASALLGRKAGFVLVGSGVFAMSIIGGGMVSGILPIRAEHMLTSLSPMAWGISLVVFGMAGVGLVILPQMFLTRLEGSLTLLEKHAEKLERSNASLQETITAREAAENKLRQSENRFRELFNAISDVIYTQDLHGRFTSVNPSLCRAFGYAADELIGRLTSDFMKPEFAAVFKKEYLDEIRQQGHHEGTAIYFKKSGEKIYLEYRSTLVHPDAGEPYISGIGKNVTEKLLSKRKLSKLRKQFTQAQKLESVGTLAGGIAHNFNNVLMGIQGRTSLMMLEKDASHPDFPHLKGIEEYVRNAAELTKDLLGFARGGKYEVSATDLNELIKHENRMFSQTKKEIQIRGTYEKHIWIVEVDQGQMRQALLNLYVNAWQAMPDGGNLHIRTENTTVHENTVRPLEIAPGRYVKISVTDTGVGMDGTTQQKIFDPFFTTRETGAGTGLGLAFVYGIIKNHGGFIEVDSRKGEGATFHLYLPASDKSVQEEKKPSREVVKGKGTILLVDDEEMIIDVGRQLLEMLGYRILTAPNGKEAVDIYEKNKADIDMVILDMIMPGMGGGDTYDRLKEINPEIKALLSSGYSIDGEAQSIMDRGCNGFVQKPYNMKEISLKVSEILNMT